MFIIGYLFQAIGNLTHFLINVYIIVIIVHSVLSWINIPRNQFTHTIDALVRPFLMKIKEFIPLGLVGNIDFTPFIGILLLYFVDQFLVSIILKIGRSLI